MRTRVTNWILPAIITVLALADGILHLRLISKLFGGKYWGSPSFGGPPPGAPAGGPAGVPGGGGPPAGGFKMPQAIPFVSLPLNELFLLNCIGFVVLTLLFWVVWLRFSRWIWAVDVVMIAYTLLAIIGWFRVGKPNPQGLGHLSKEIEIALIVALLAHLCYLFVRERSATRVRLTSAANLSGGL
jgi:hypothetical protein